jgi:hypothetical protein
MASRRWRVVRLAGVGVVILALGLTVASILNRNTKMRQCRVVFKPGIFCS